MKLPLSSTAFLCALAVCPGVALAAQTNALPAGAVATVNGVPVMKSTIDDHLWRESGAVTLDYMVKSQIIRSEAAKRGIVVSPEALQERMQDYKTTFLTAGGHTPLDWENLVKRYGLKNIEDQQRDTLLAIRIGEDEASKAALSPDEETRVRADLTRAAHTVHARIILIGVGPEFDGRSETAAKERAASAKAALASGKAWDTVCQEYSDDVTTRPHGGDLGMVTRDQVEKPLEDALFSSKPGPDSLQIIRVSSGFVIAELLERSDKTPSESEIKKALDDTLARKKSLAKEIPTWFPAVEKAHKIQQQLPYER